MLENIFKTLRADYPQVTEEQWEQIQQRAEEILFPYAVEVAGQAIDEIVPDLEEEWGE